MVGTCMSTLAENKIVILLTYIDVVSIFTRVTDITSICHKKQTYVTVCWTDKTQVMHRFVRQHYQRKTNIYIYCFNTFIISPE